MVTISSTTAAPCPRSFATMQPCTECTHHLANDIGRGSTHLPFCPSMRYEHAYSSRIISVDAAARYFPDDPEAMEAAMFWAENAFIIHNGYTNKSTAADWLPADFDQADDDSRSDLGAPEVDETTWTAPPPTYQETVAASSSSSSSSSKRHRTLFLRRGERSADAGTLGLGVNSSAIDVSDTSSSSSSSSSSSNGSGSSSTSASTFLAIEPKQPSLFCLALFGSRRATARAQRQAERRAARLEELHDAWARVGINTRERLAAGGVDALPAFFEHPPRCEFQEMLDELPL